MALKAVHTDLEKQTEFMELYTPLNARLSRFCEALTKNREDARDLMSDTILTAFEHFDQLKSKEAFLSYLFGTASNIFKNKNRQKKWWGVFEQKKAEEVSGSYSDAEMSTDLSLLYHTLSKMPEEQKMALLLFEVSGLSIKEICEVQKVGESAVKSRISRARQELVKLMGEKKPKLSTLRMVSMVLNSFLF